jgi:hypothetical protein
MRNWLQRYLERQAQRRRADLTVPGLKSLSWKGEDCAASLDAVFDHIHQDATSAIRWYTNARRPKRHLSFGSRLIVVVAFGVAAILPLLAQLGAAPGAPTWIRTLGAWSLFEPVWISIVLAIAAGAVAFDRALGGSTGWIRYIKTELQLRDALESFELEWECQRAAMQGERPCPQQTEAMLQRARTFAAEVNAIVQDETNAWVDEFQSSLRQIDEAVRARSVAEKAEKAETRARNAGPPGALNLTVVNGELAAGGWSVSIDGGAERRFSGRKGAISDVVPGVHVFKVVGEIEGTPRETQVAA